jgi:superfamily II DNA or RNA helicase
MQGYLYFVINGSDKEAPEDQQIFIKIGRTKSPMDRISQYITHTLGDVIPQYYKVWRVENDTTAEVDALEFFKDKRIKKGTSTILSEVMKATKAEVDAYKPKDPTAKAIAPHTMMPSEQYSERVEAITRFEEHWHEIKELQEPTVKALVEFFLNKEGDAKVLQAPCGIGKTHMTCSAIMTAAAQEETFKVVVIVPTKLIAQQWQGTFKHLGIAAPIVTRSDVSVIIDGKRVSKEDQVKHRFMIMTYSSCGALEESDGWVYIFDEAHHTTGEASTDNSGFGSTKGLVNRAASAKNKRLFLTFTPKTGLNGSKVNSMDNKELYGDYIPFPPLSQLVNSGLLPDYRLTITNAKSFKTLDVVAKEVPRARKIIVYLKDIKEIEEAQKYLLEDKEGRPISQKKDVIVAHGQMSENEITLAKEKFTEPSPDVTFLLTCLLLLEGADIPIADTAVLLAPWQTKPRLIQLLLRPGRWFPKKPTFNIVVPHDDGTIQGTLSIAGFTVSPGKHRILVPQKDGEEAEEMKTIDIIRKASHIWCVSYTDKNTLSADETVPAEADFEKSIKDCNISALQNGLNNAAKGDCIILKGPSNIVVAVVDNVGTSKELVKKTDGKTGNRTRTSLQVRFLTPDSNKEANIRIPLNAYKKHVSDKWKADRKEDWSWITNPRYNPGNKYDSERRELLLELMK